MSEGQTCHCGPDRWWKWTRCHLSKDPIFNEACRLHDGWYRSGMVQKEADDKMYTYLKEKIGTGWRTWYKQFQAWSYYQSVRKFGKKAWEKAQKEKPDGI